MSDRERDKERPGYIIGPTSGGPDAEITSAGGIAGSPHSDAEILGEVRARLAASSLEPHHLEVRVEDRVVTLRGPVPDAAAKHVAEHIGESVAGVHAVRSELRLEEDSA